MLKRSLILSVICLACLGLAVSASAQEPIPQPDPAAPAPPVPSTDSIPAPSAPQSDTGSAPAPVEPNASSTDPGTGHLIRAVRSYSDQHPSTPDSTRENRHDPDMPGDGNPRDSLETDGTETQDDIANGPAAPNMDGSPGSPTSPPDAPDTSASAPAEPTIAADPAAPPPPSSNA